MEIKNKIYEVFFDLNDVIYIIKDENENIIFPNDLETLKLYREILKSKIRTNNDFYHKLTKTWYKLSKEKIIDENNKILTIEFLENITDFKEQLYNLKIDTLTKLLKDRDECDRLIFEYISHAIKNKEDFSVVMADVDKFKVINDTYGHMCGDLVLKKIGRELLKSTRQSEDKFDYRPSDIVTRIGGDEFLILFKNISLNDTKKRINLLEKAIKNMRVIYENDIVPVEMSFGYCNINIKKDMNISALILEKSMVKTADEYLYIHKNRKKVNEQKELDKIKKLSCNKS